MEGKQPSQEPPRMVRGDSIMSPMIGATSPRNPTSSDDLQLLRNKIIQYDTLIQSYFQKKLELESVQTKFATLQTQHSDLQNAYEQLKSDSTRAISAQTAEISLLKSEVQERNFKIDQQNERLRLYERAYGELKREQIKGESMQPFRLACLEKKSEKQVLPNEGITDQEQQRKKELKANLKRKIQEPSNQIRCDLETTTKRVRFEEEDAPKTQSPQISGSHTVKVEQDSNQGDFKERIPQYQQLIKNMEGLAAIAKKQKRIILFFTGFGKFGKVLENPTTYLSKAIKDLLEVNPIEGVVLHANYIVTVSIDHCNEALAEIYQKINELIAKEKEDQTYENHYVVLHMGVYQGSGRFNVEVQGKNIKHFRIPDEMGNTPLNQCIDETQDITYCLKNRLNVNQMVGNLFEKGYKVGESMSAGEYICNYTYFCSLKAKCERVVIPDKVDSLFCHVPTFEEIDEPTQQKFLLDLITEIRDDILRA
ncbi:hypothetical protein FGO68_gene13848 [Halteria grandinella]|uniref:Uncharacterized protein n=1 Tax=Halteria grandinella TaxID=5974 RepID=A0A8J8T2J7_HALGN|nr:hypothetical protein FGO68_gene13848 [Halteria grandinella]